MALRVITAPASEPVALAEMKNYLRVDIPDDDNMISAFIIAAREWCEAFQNRAFITQKLELTLDHFPGRLHPHLWSEIPFDAFSRHGFRRHHHNAIKLIMPPIQSVTSITYTDSTGVITILDPTTYIVDTSSEPGRVVPVSGQEWPVVQLQPINGVQIQYIAGYGDASETPLSVKQSIMMLVAYWYQNREAAGKVDGEIAFAVRALLSMQRVIPT